MAKDDYFKNVYIILQYLYKKKKAGMRADLDEISAEALKINETYRDTILEEMLEAGYVKGFKVKKYITSTVLSGLEDIDITMAGIEFLQDNSKMKKIHEILKNVKDLASFAL